MTSNVNPNNIDGTYPIAGQDNDSQGFRTNFTNIKNNFIYSKSELEDLQGKVVLKAALSGNALDNNMSGAVFRSAEVRDLRETKVDMGTISGTATLDHTVAPFYALSTSGAVSVDFSGFPAAGRIGRIRLEVTVNNLSDTIVLPATVTYGLVGLRGFDGVDTIEFDSLGTFIFEFVTDDGGTSVHIIDLSRTRTNTVKIIGAAPAAAGTAGDIPGMTRYDSINRFLYVCVGEYDGSTHIWHKVNGTAGTAL